MIELDFLKNVRVFNGLNDEQLNKILSGCKEKEYKYNNRLFKEGDKAQYIWMVNEGQVDIRFELPGRDTSPVTTLYTETPRKTFGWSSFVPPYEYILSAYCSSPRCRVAQIDKEFLFKIFKSDPDTGYILMSNLAGVMSLRFHDIQKSLVSANY